MSIVAIMVVEVGDSGMLIEKASHCPCVDAMCARSKGMGYLLGMTSDIG